jgi:hypothetical protein
MQVSVELQGLMAEMKERVRLLVINELNRTFDTTPLNGTVATTNIVKRLNSINILVGTLPAPSSSPETSPQYVKPDFGHIQQISFSNAANNPSVVLLVTKLGLPCGNDISVSGLKRISGQWRTLFVREVNDYSLISDAIGDLTLQVSRPGQDGGFLAVSAASGACAQPPMALRLSALRVQLDEAFGSELFSSNDTNLIQDAVLSPATISAEPDSFEVSFNVGKFLERGQPTRSKTLRFAVFNQKLVPTAPSIPNEVRMTDFVDEWFALPANKANLWVDGVAKSIIDCRRTIIGNRVGSQTQPQILGVAPSCQPETQVISIGFSGLSDKFYVSVGRKNGVGTIVGLNTRPPVCAP